jgi:hypothetical protein
MNKVFVLHQPAVRDRETGAFRPQFDLSPALAYGRIVEVLPPGAFLDTFIMAEKAKRVLEREGFDGEDYILALGDPVAIAIGVLAAAKCLRGKAEHIHLLRWDRRNGAYTPCDIEILSP